MRSPTIFHIIYSTVFAGDFRVTDITLPNKRVTKFPTRLIARLIAKRFRDIHKPFAKDKYEIIEKNK